MPQDRTEEFMEPESDDEEYFTDEDTNVYGQFAASTKGPAGRTAAFLKHLNGLSHRRIAAKLRRVIDYMCSEQLDVATLLYFLTWNLDNDDGADLTDDDPDSAYTHKQNLDVIKYARTGLSGFERLSEILQNLRCPPREHDRGIRTQAARETMDRWAINNVKMLINTDMKNLARMMECTQKEVTEESLLAIDFGRSIEQARGLAPTFWELLMSAACTPRQLRRNANKDPSEVGVDFFYLSVALTTFVLQALFMTLCQLSFSRSNKRSKFQKLMSIYFKSCGVSGKAADTLYLWKICMNQKWIYGMLERMGEKNHKAMLRDIHERDLPFGGSHDNINLGFRVYEQCRDNKSRFDSGTAATIYTFSDPACVPPDPKAYQQKWQEGVKDPIESLDILDLEANGDSKMSLQDNYIVLKILISSPEFDFKTYPHNSDPLFARPPPVQ
jgi:hypothetical protein